MTPSFRTRRSSDLNGLRRPAYKTGHPAYALSTIGISWFVESAFNTAFLRVTDEYGIIGGFIDDAVIAAVNVGLAAAVGRFWRSEEPTSELQSLMRISYPVFCLTQNIIYITK